MLLSLHWRHNKRVPNHQRLHCLLNCCFRRRSKKTSKLRVTDLCAGNSIFASPPGHNELKQLSCESDKIIRSPETVSPSAWYYDAQESEIYQFYHLIRPSHAREYLYGYVATWGISKAHKIIASCMLSSSTGIIFCVTGPLCLEFIGQRWIVLTKASDAEPWCLLWFTPEQTIE